MNFSKIGRGGFWSHNKTLSDSSFKNNKCKWSQTGWFSTIYVSYGTKIRKREVETILRYPTKSAKVLPKNTLSFLFRKVFMKYTAFRVHFILEKRVDRWKLVDLNISRKRVINRLQTFDSKLSRWYFASGLIENYIASGLNENLSFHSPLFLHEYILISENEQDF